MVECLDGLARITSRELTLIHSVKSDTLQSSCSTRPRVVVGLGEKCSYAHRQLEEQPTKRSKKKGDKSAVAMLKKNEHHHRTGRLVVNVYSSNTRQLGCVFQGNGAAEVFIDFADELRHTETDSMCKIHENRCTSRSHSRPKSFAWNDLIW